MKISIHFPILGHLRHQHNQDQKQQPVRPSKKPCLVTTYDNTCGIVALHGDVMKRRNNSNSVKSLTSIQINKQHVSDDGIR